MRSKAKQSLVGNMNTDNSTEQGIKTIEVEKLSEFTANSALCIYTVTWNMNGKVSSEDLAKLVRCDRDFDLLVVGLQEVPRCNIAQLLQEILVETHSLLGKSILQSVQLFVFGANNYKLPINKEIKTDKYDVGGFGGLIRRKKGAVAIGITVKGIRMVFISCHLAAHPHNVEQRNSQVRQISHSLFSANQNPYAKPSHITVWLGDLNYRIQGVDSVSMRNLVDRGFGKLLTSKDQLLREAEKGQIFEGYCEGALLFKPTYKYDVGTSNYDTSRKVRVPSWTDRVLYKIENFDEFQATLHSYVSLDHIYSSDHKPVKALLSLKHTSAESSLHHQ